MATKPGTISTLGQVQKTVPTVLPPAPALPAGTKTTTITTTTAAPPQTIVPTSYGTVTTTQPTTDNNKSKREPIFLIIAIVLVIAAIIGLLIYWRRISNNPNNNTTTPTSGVSNGPFPPTGSIVIFAKSITSGNTTFTNNNNTLSLSGYDYCQQQSQNLYLLPSSSNTGTTNVFYISTCSSGNGLLTDNGSGNYVFTSYTGNTNQQWYLQNLGTNSGGTSSTATIIGDFTIQNVSTNNVISLNTNNNISPTTFNYTNLSQVWTIVTPTCNQNPSCSSPNVISS